MARASSISSVGGKEISAVEQAAIDYAFGKGVVIVVAAGNEGVDVSKYGVTGSDKVLTVATTGFDDQRAVFSNWGKVSVAAPGLDILSLRARRTDTMLGIEGVKYTAGAAYVGEDKRYYRASGTSFSAPMVSGLASLMIANDPSLTNRQVMAIIKSTARDVGTPGCRSVHRLRHHRCGGGAEGAEGLLAVRRDRSRRGGAEGQGQAVRVRGTADANALKGARLEIGQATIRRAGNAWVRCARSPDPTRCWAISRRHRSPVRRSGKSASSSRMAAAQTAKHGSS